MNEQEWLNCENPYPMLVFLRGPAVDPQQRHAQHLSRRQIHLFPGPGDRVSSRKVLLFMAECTRRLSRLPLGGPSETALEAFRRYADGTGDRQTFLDACLATELRDSEGRVVGRLAWEMWTADPLGAGYVVSAAKRVVANHVSRDSAAVFPGGMPEEDRIEWVFRTHPTNPLWQSTFAAEERTMADLLRHVVGNPFRSVEADPSWLAWNDGAVHKIAQMIYDERRFSELPLLADALEDAGCTNPDILSHCRQPGPHIRGCWVVDLLTGRE